MAVSFADKNLSFVLFCSFKDAIKFLAELSLSVEVFLRILNCLVNDATIGLQVSGIGVFV